MPGAETETWTQAHERNTAAVRDHPRFHDLVREVAVAEQPSGTPWRLRNSITFAVWWGRGVKVPRRSLSARAQALARQIADDLAIFPWDHNRHEATAMVYVTARDNVRSRLR